MRAILLFYEANILFIHKEAPIKKPLIMFFLVLSSHDVIKLM